MVITLQLPLGLYKLQGLMICVDDLLLQNAMFPLLTNLHNGMYLLIVGVVFPNYVKKCLIVIGHRMSLLSENCTNSIVRGVCLNFKWFL